MDCVKIDPKKIDPERLPTGEVIALSCCWYAVCQALVGTLYVEYDDNSDNYPDFKRVDCTDGRKILRHITHYVDLYTMPDPDSVVKTPTLNENL
jgi:hypothetical protein